MFVCDQCDRDFDTFLTPGKCPICASWITITCADCGHSGPASGYLNHESKCPQCDRATHVPGSLKHPRWLVAALVCVVVLLLVSLLIFATDWLS